MESIHIKINNKTIPAQPGQNILQVAKSAGIDIPSMCYHEGLPHFTSCMVCLVKDRATGKLLPSCSVKPAEGMDIVTDDPEVLEARKKSLELLLSDHVGECEAPCTIACPAHMDIPRMNRLLADGKMDEALHLVRKDIALPAVLGRICPAPCEAVCRRKDIDGAVSICLLKRFAGDEGKISIAPNPFVSDKKVAVVGAGPAGLSAAFYIREAGFACTLFDEAEKAGGQLRTAISDKILPKEVLDKEIQMIADAGVEFRLGEKIDFEKLKELQNEFDALVLATGDDRSWLSEFGIEVSEKGALVDRTTYRSKIPNVFVVGNAFRSSKMAIRSLAQGKEVGIRVSQFLKSEKVTGPTKRFNSRFGKLMQTEFAEYLKEATNVLRQNPQQGGHLGFSTEEVQQEASRCLHCDCRKLDNCKLRDYADEYQADQKKYKYGERNPIHKFNHHSLIVYEPEKCIKCSICIRLAEKHKERLGLTFIGRGFDVQIAVPFNESLDKGLEKVAKEIAEACPTGAMAIR